MENRRIFLYAALFFVSYLLWNAWHEEHPSEKVISKEGSSITTSLESNETPVNVDDKSAKSPIHLEKTEAKGALISVKSDVLSLMIDEKTGNIMSAKLTRFPVKADDPNEPVTLLYDTPDGRYVAESGLLIAKDGKVQGADVSYHSDKKEYVMNDSDATLDVVLSGKTSNGLSVKKILTLDKNSYLIKVRYELQNESDAPFYGYLNTTLLEESPKEDESSLFHVGSYTGASYSDPTHRYQKVSFKEMKKKNLETKTTGGWIAMQQHYFLSAWIPDENQKGIIYTRSQGENFTIGAVSSKIELKPQESVSLKARLYIGPEDTETLKKISNGLDLTVDYGWFWFLSSLLFSLMKFIYSIVHNWGLSIILVTFLIKLAFYRLSAKSYQSMAGMRKLQPRLQALRERFGDDRTALSQATMELYRQEKINPLGGCLPVLIQIPVFIALYWVLLESVELRQAPFVFWIKDLSSPDPFHILPLIMGGTMWIQQQLNPAPPDPVQAKVMMFLPLLFTAIFWNFPSGLVLYWIVNNLLSILQQWHITRKYGVVEETVSKKPLSLVK